MDHLALFRYLGGSRAAGATCKVARHRFMSLKDSVYTYTEHGISEIQPDYIQLGNEINTGFLHPYGHITNNYLQFIDLMDTAIAAVRTRSIDTELILHYAGSAASDWFFNQVAPLDYDIIGLSYYPIWHGKSLDSLQARMQYLAVKRLELNL